MTDEERLAALLEELSNQTGKRLRFNNEVLEALGPDATVAQQIGVAERVLAEPCRGWAGGVYEQARSARLRREQ